MSTHENICRCISHGCARQETTNEMGYPTQGKKLGIHKYWEHCRGDKHLRYQVRQLCWNLESVSSVCCIVRRYISRCTSAGGDIPQCTSISVLWDSHSNSQSARVASREDTIAHSLEPWRLVCLSFGPGYSKIFASKTLSSAGCLKMTHPLPPHYRALQ